MNKPARPPFPYLQPLRLVAMALVTLAVPILCFTTAVRVLALSPGFYQWGQERHVIYSEPSSTARAAADLALVRYFDADAGTLGSQLRAVGLAEDFFGERERAHLKDVHSLIQSVKWLQLISAMFLAATLVLVGLRRVRSGWRSAMRALRLGAGITWGIIILLAVGSLLDFDALFLQFHLLSFSNDLWQLNPNHDNLIRMFPTAFFLEAALAATAAAGAQASLIGGLALWNLRRQ